MCEPVVFIYCHYLRLSPWAVHALNGWKWGVQPFLAIDCNEMIWGHWERADPHARKSCRTLRGCWSVPAATWALQGLQLLQ